MARGGLCLGRTLVLIPILSVAYLVGLAFYALEWDERCA